MKRPLFWLLAVFISTTVQATGYFRSTDTLEELRLAFDRNDPGEKAAYYRGYVEGVADSGNGDAWCPPSKVSSEQIYAIVSKYIKEHPASATNQDAAAVVTTALATSFPCRKQ